MIEKAMLQLRYVAAVMFVVVLIGYVYIDNEFIVADPWVYTEIRQLNGQVNFSFFVQRRTWRFGASTKVSHKISGVMVGNANGVLWEVRGRSPDKEVGTLSYGVVPEGFDQITPKSGVAPPLIKGVEYEVSVRSSGAGVTKFVRH